MSRKITKKRMIAFIVSLSMVASMIPAMAFGAVTGVSLNKSKLTMETESTYTLTATVTVDAGEAQTVTWSSDDESVATVEDGVVTAVSEGTADITATSTADDTKMATCRVTVYDTALTIVLGTRADPIVVKEFSNADLSKIGFSKYLLSRLNATTFSKDIHTGSTKYPRDIFVYYTDNIEFGQILDPDDYIVECSLEGTLGIAYKGDSKVYTTKINAKPMVMYKESTKCRFIIPVKIDSTNTRRVEKIDTSQAYISYRIYGKIQEH